MVVNKRTKRSRYRASQTHGGGAKKKRRGGGNRGGRGNAGSGKRADSKGPSHWKDPKYFGKFGFTSKNRRSKDIALNLNLLKEMMPSLIEKKFASKEKDGVVVDRGKAGYTKLLGEGTPDSKMLVTVNYASAKAIEKVKEAGGDVIVRQSTPKK